MRDGIHNLGIRDTEDLAEFLLYHLTMELRIKLMSERPALYARLYPSVPSESLAGRVADSIDNGRG